MIGILNAYHFDFTKGNYQEIYNRDITDFLTRIFPNEHIRHYKIANNEWPSSLDECRVWVVTGSSNGASDDLPWIHRLSDLIRELHKHKKKLIGICFGHQMIAQALGGKVEKSLKGWGVGVRPFQVIQKQPWMRPAQTSVALIFSHQDQVVSLPPQAILLAQDAFCPYQMFQVGNHILALQGHPEFSVEFAKNRLLARKDKMDPDTYGQAMKSFTDPKDDNTLGLWLHEFAKI